MVSKSKKSALKELNLSKYDLIISYGYKHIISNKIIKKLKKPIINLHIGYLPYNKRESSKSMVFFRSNTKWNIYS